MSLAYYFKKWSLEALDQSRYFLWQFGSSIRSDADQISLMVINFVPISQCLGTRRQSGPYIDLKNPQGGYIPKAIDINGLILNSIVVINF